MACSCKNKGKRGTYTVKLPGGLTVTKSTEAAAVAFAAKHPGSKVAKPATT
jgi:hypothetical protein